MSHESNKYQVLGLSEEQARFMEEAAKVLGIEVVKRHIWTGPVPERGSYMVVDDNVKMSTPEFFFFRMANVLDEVGATEVGYELCGYYQTSATCSEIPEDMLAELDEPQTCVANILRYLWQVHDTPEGERALEILSKIADGAKSPEDAAYLYYVRNLQS